MGAYDDLLRDDDDENEDSLTGDTPDPVDTIAGPSTNNPAVAERIQQVRQGTSNDPVGPPAPSAPTSTPSSPFSPTDLAAMEYAHGAQQDASIGRALNSVASGFGAKVDNGGYDALVNNASTTAKDVMDRSTKVSQAIAARDLKQQAMAETKRKDQALEDYRSKSLGIKSKLADAIAGQRTGKAQQQAMTNTRSMIESSRGNQAAQQAERDLYASSKLKTLFDKFGDLNKLSPQMANLAVMEVAKMAAGATPDDHMLKQLNPAAFQGQLATLWQKVSNEPTPANAGEFLKQYKDYADSMTEDARSLINDRYGRIIDAAEGDIGDANANKLRDVYLHRFDKGQAPGKVLAAGAPDGGMIQSAGAADLPGVGDVVDGYKFKGGDPSKQESWEQVH